MSDDLSASSTGPAGPGATNARSPAMPAAARGHFDVTSIPTAPQALEVYVRNATAKSPAIEVAETSAPTAKPLTAVQVSLDRRMAAFSGPYTVEGKQVTAPAQFRMMTGYNDPAIGVRPRDLAHHPYDCLQINHSAELQRIAARVGVDIQVFQNGCPTPTQLVSVTQALIDAGKLPPVGVGSVEVRIKTMQWQWGIGIDCTNYTATAAAGAVGAKVTPRPGCDYFTADPGKNRALMKVSPEAAVPGDVFCLNSTSGSVGHRAVVYSRTTCDDATRAALVNRFHDVAANFLGSGRVQVFEVDSSWGAGPLGATSGGVRRDTWLYNTDTKKWAQISPRLTDNVPDFLPSTSNGPYCEDLQGVYRFRGTP